MKKFSRVAFFVSAALSFFCAASCSEKTSPVEDAIRKQIMIDNPDITGLSISELKVVEKVSFGSELEHSFKLFRSKEKLERQRYEKYSAESKPANAALHLEKAQTSARILEALELYKAAHSSSADSILYYVVSFKMNYNKSDRTPIAKLASVTSDFKIGNIVDPTRSAKAGMSSTMPGYSALIDSCKPDKVEESLCEDDEKDSE